MSVSEWGGDSGTVGRDAAETVASVAAPGRTPATEGDRTPGSAQGESEAEFLAAYIRAAINSWRHHFDSADDDGETMDRFVAAALVRHGYRLVSEDDTTVDRVARRMLASNGEHLVAWAECRAQVRERYRALARAAVRALREAGE